MTDLSHADSVKEELKKLWAEAQRLLQRKIVRLEKLYGDEFIFIHSPGEVNTKPNGSTGSCPS